MTVVYFDKLDKGFIWMNNNMINSGVGSQLVEALKYANTIISKNVHDRINKLSNIFKIKFCATLHEMFSTGDFINDVTIHSMSKQNTALLNFMNGTNYVGYGGDGKKPIVIYTTKVDYIREMCKDCEVFVNECYPTTKRIVLVITDTNVDTELLNYAYVLT